MIDRSENIDVEKVILHWKETSLEDFNTMIDLYNSKTYHWSLFMGHISTEKLLKAYYVKVKKKHAPPIHNLYRLAEISDIEITNEYADWLDTIHHSILMLDMMILRGSFSNNVLKIIPIYGLSE